MLRNLTRSIPKRLSLQVFRLALKTDPTATSTTVVVHNYSFRRIAAIQLVQPFSSSSLFYQHYTAAKLSDQEYHKVSSLVLDNLTEEFETLLEEADIPNLDQKANSGTKDNKTSSYNKEWDLECASGVLNFRCGIHGTYVINKQPPNRQIWLSSPKSGPKRFDYDADKNEWFSLKEGELVTLKQLLDVEIAEIFDTHVDLVVGEEHS